MSRCYSNLIQETKSTIKQLTALEKHLLNDFQHTIPLVSRPFLEIAQKFDCSENEIIATLNKLKEQQVISRIGAVFRANSIGASTLAAMAVPEERLESIAEMISSYREVNHNYQREHYYNLWFVLTTENEQTLNSVLDDIEHRSGLAVMYLPMLEDYHIDLGFTLNFEQQHDSEQLC